MAIDVNGRTINTTNYRHSSEPNLNELHRTMEYDPEGHPILRVKDAQAGYTSKNRIKVSLYQTTFFNTFQYGKETDVWDELTANGGAATWNTNTNNVDMSARTFLS